MRTKSTQRINHIFLTITLVIWCWVIGSASAAECPDLVVDEEIIVDGGCYGIIFVKNDGKLTINGNTTAHAVLIQWGQCIVNGNLDVTDYITVQANPTGTMTVNGDVSANSISVENATLTVSENVSTQQISIEDGTMTINGTLYIPRLTLQSGKLTVATNGSSQEQPLESVIVESGELHLCGDWFVNDMRINGGVVYVIPYSDSLEGSGRFVLECDYFALEEDASINANAAGGEMLGKGVDVHVNSSAGGGGYGGKGGRSGGAGGNKYGDNFSLTIKMGSRGGNAGHYAGGKGSGSVSIISTGSVAIYGAMLANGNDGGRGGGGSGGGVLIHSSNLELMGSIAANGGNGIRGGGGGGGGRIKLFYVTGFNINNATDKLSVNGGSSHQGGQPGQPGTIWTNAYPSSPELIAPKDDASLATHRPTFKFNVMDTSVDTDNRDEDLSCIIELSVDNFATIYKNYDQNVSLAGWSKFSYKSGDQAEYTPTEDLPEGVYQWRSAIRDKNFRSENSEVRSFKLGTPPTIKVEASTFSLSANGESTSLITATLTSPEGKPVMDEVVVMRLDGDGILSDVTNNNDGTYTATYTAGEKPGTVKITATATNSNVSDTVEIKLESPTAPCDYVDVTTNTLAVTGTVYRQTKEVAEDGLPIEVNIITQNLTEMDMTGTAGDGQYSVTFVDMQKPVAKAGDEILITVKDDGGKLVGQSRHTLTAAEVEANMTRIDVTPCKAYDVRPVTLTLHKGINVISVPVKAEKVLRMSDLAQNIGKDNLAMIIRYDYTQDKFISYLPTFPDASPANAVVQPNEGYIVVMKADKDVEFEGTTVSEKNPSEDETAAPSLMPPILSSNQSHKKKLLVSEAKRFSEAKLLNEVNISIFVVTGDVKQEETGEILNEVSVKIRNLRTGQTVENITGTLAGYGNYVTTFAASSEEFMTRATDELEITAIDKNNRFVVTTVTHMLTTHDISDYVLFMPLHLSLPKKSTLLQNYPNPFNPETWIPYQLPEDTNVTISIYNIKGQLIRMLHLGQKPAGMYISKDRAAHWNGKNEHGEMVSSGVYFYRLNAGDFTAMRRMVILK